MSNAKAEECCAEVFRGYHYYPCGKKGKVQRNGKWYCGRCDPDAVASRNAKAEARYQDAVNARIDAHKAERIRDARAAAFPAIVEALRELLRVDDDWHGSVNSEMATARNRSRAALAQADAIEEQP